MASVSKNQAVRAVCAMLVAALPSSAWADAATHVLTLEATSRPASANEGPSCLLVGHLKAVGVTSSAIDVVLVSGGDSEAEQGDLIFSFTGMSAGATASAQVDVGGGGCADLVIRKARVQCPNDGRIDLTYSCRAFTWVQFPQMDTPRMTQIRVGEQWETGVRPTSLPGPSASPRPATATALCSPSDAVASVAAGGGGSGVVPPNLLVDALQDLAKHGCPSSEHRSVGVVDFSPPSGTPRMWIVDLDTGTGLDRPIYVAHGKGSDPSNGGRASFFGDRKGSFMSSLGGYRVLKATTTRKHGPVILLKGLDPSNRHAMERAILIHTSSRNTADYVSLGWLMTYGKLGRSHGCFVVISTEFPHVSAALRNGGFLYAGRSAAGGSAGR